MPLRRAGGVLAAGAVVVAATLAGCGGGGTEGAAAGTPSWQERVQTVCTDVFDQLERVPKSGSPAGAARMLREFVRITTDGEDRLDAVRVPYDVEPRYAEFIGVMRDWTGSMRRAAQALEDHDVVLGKQEVPRLFGSANEVRSGARTLGIPACGGRADWSTDAWA